MSSSSSSSSSSSVPRATVPRGSLLLTNGRIFLGVSDAHPEGEFVSAIAIRDGVVCATGTTEELEAKYATSSLKKVNLGGRTVVPGLNDSHLHVIREGLHFNLEVRWDGVRTLAQGLNMIREQARRTPAGQWVRVVGGWSEHQFEEKRLPTLAELDEAGQGRPVFVLHLYDCALVNRAGMALLGYTKATPNPPSGEIVRDATTGEPTGLLIARPNAFLLYNTLNMLPKMSHAEQKSSTLAYQRELHRFGVTSVMDPGGGFQNYPNDYGVVQELDAEGALAIRIAFSLFPQKPGAELDDFKRWATMIKPGDGSPYLKHLGAGEMLAFSAADFEDFKEARPDLPPVMEADLEAIVRFLVSVRWPFRLHATYGESIERELVVFEKIAAENPSAFHDLRFFIDHAETISLRDAKRIHALGGGIAIQHRMAFQGEYFLERYGQAACQRAPPIADIKSSGVHVGAGTDGTRVATYNPWVSVHWLVSGRSVGGVDLSPDASQPRNAVSRVEALRLWTQANAWFTREEATKGGLFVGMLADAIVLDKDYFTCPEIEIRDLESTMTIVDGRIVYVAPQTSGAPLEVEPTPQPTLQPSWSPVARFGGYQIAHSTAWQPTPESLVPLSAAAHEEAAREHAQAAAAAATTVNPMQFFEHGHDC